MIVSEDSKKSEVNGVFGYVFFTEDETVLRLKNMKSLIFFLIFNITLSLQISRLQLSSEIVRIVIRLLKCPEVGRCVLLNIYKYFKTNK